MNHWITALKPSSSPYPSQEPRTKTFNNNEASFDGASVDADFGVSAAPSDAVSAEPDVPLNSSTLPTSVDSIVGGSSTAASSP
ncbi:hypothetical protein Dimus_023230 [Dionaea muscipula]